MAELAQPLPHAPEEPDWAFVQRADGAETVVPELVYRVAAAVGEGPALPATLSAALPLLLHEFELVPIGEVLDRFDEDRNDPLLPRAQTTLSRILPRLLTYRFLEQDDQFEFRFAGFRPQAAHVLARVLETDLKFRLEDLSHFASHGELLLAVLEAVDLTTALDANGVIYAPAVDSPFPFKFAVVGYGARNRTAFINLLVRLLKQTESDEDFRARHFRELTRGFQKFGPAAATPAFQEVELRLWRILSYTAARLRVKAGRLTTTEDPDEVRTYLRELRSVHAALDRLVHLPSRLAAFFRTNFSIEFSSLAEQALLELGLIAAEVDCDPTSFDRSIESIAGMVSEFRRLGSSAPLEELEAHDRAIRLAYGDQAVPPLETGWARTYSAAIFTGAERFDTRRFKEPPPGEVAEEEVDLSLDVDLNLFGGSPPEAPGVGVEGRASEAGVVGTGEFESEAAGLIDDVFGEDEPFTGPAGDELPDDEIEDVEDAELEDDDPGGLDYVDFDEIEELAEEEEGPSADSGYDEATAAAGDDLSGLDELDEDLRPAAGAWGDEASGRHEAPQLSPSFSDLLENSWGGEDEPTLEEALEQAQGAEELWEEASELLREEDDEEWM